MRYLNGFTVVDTLDPAAMAKHVPAGTFAGSLSYEETRVEAHARLAAAAGHRASPPDAVAACRDKFAGRETLRRAGVPQARSVAVAGLDEARVAAAEIGYPVVVKPRAPSASGGPGRSGREDIRPG